MKKTKHTVALALAAMLACQPLSVYAATFAHMNQVPWRVPKHLSIRRQAWVWLLGKPETAKPISAPEILFLCPNPASWHISC